MGKLVEFRNKQRALSADEIDFNSLLKNAVEIGGRALGEVKEGIFCPIADIKSILVSEINALLLREKQIDDELFRCALYVGGLFDYMASHVPESYFVCDYYIKGWEEKKPEYYLQGADLCYLISVLFEKYAERRSMHKADYVRMGIKLYYDYYLQTGKTIGWCMSNNFNGIVDISKRGIENFQKR
jgi:hypothetical protein